MAVRGLGVWDCAGEASEEGRRPLDDAVTSVCCYVAAFPRLPSVVVDEGLDGGRASKGGEGGRQGERSGGS